LRELVADPAGIERNDPVALSHLIEGLMLGGFAMQAAKSSRAASGAEHQFSHLWDMQHHTHHGKSPSHGFKVGIGTLAVTALYDYLLRQPLETCDIERACQAWPDEGSREARIRDLFDERDLAAVALQETRAKSISETDLRKQLERLRSTWPGLQERLRGQLLPFPHLKLMLAAAGAPVEPEQIGISRERLRRSFEQAWFIRRRFTFWTGGEAWIARKRAGADLRSLRPLAAPCRPSPLPNERMK
jgi:glycerol-1-phosphate dehydrogenase [NAD(P)+]